MKTQRFRDRKYIFPDLTAITWENWDLDTSIMVRLRCYKKIATGWFKQQKFISHGPRDWKFENRVMFWRLEI